MILYEKLGDNKIKFTYKISEKTFEQAIHEAYKAYGHSYPVPGFRKKTLAPLTLIEKHYGENVFYEDAFNILFQYYYGRSVQMFKLVPLTVNVDGKLRDADPEIEIGYFGYDQVPDDEQREKAHAEHMPIKFALTVTTDADKTPSVKLGEVTGIEVAKADFPVTDEEISKGVEEHKQKLLEDAKSEQHVERAVINGDKVLIDYSGAVDGKKFEGGTAEKQDLTIGSNQFIPGFEEQLIGMNIGEERDIQVTFPTEYHAEDLAGKDAVFHVKLHGVSEVITPEFNDDLVSERTEHATVADYTKAITEHVTEELNATAKRNMENKAVELACEKCEFSEIPSTIIEAEGEEIANTAFSGYGISNIGIDSFCGITQQSREEFLSGVEKAVKIDLMLLEIGAKQGLIPTESDLYAFASERAKEYFDSRNMLSEDTDADAASSMIDAAAHSILSEQGDDLVYHIVRDRAVKYIADAMVVK